MATPIYGTTEWAAAQATPWLVHNPTIRLHEALLRGSVLDRDLTAPPGTCADGACYLVDATATGAWAGHDGELAVAVGVNAASGWLFATVETEGQILYVEDEAIRIEYVAAAWGPAAGGASALDDLTDVNAPTPADGDVLTWDSGAGEWVPAAGGGGGSLPVGGTTGQVLAKQSGTDGDADWVDPVNIASSTVLIDTMAALVNSSSASDAYACAGTRIDVTADTLVHGIYAPGVYDSTATHEAIIYEINTSTNVFISEIAVSSLRAAYGSSVTGYYMFRFASAVTLLSGHRYVLGFRRTDGTGTTAAKPRFYNAANFFQIAPFTVVGVYQIANKTTPTVGDAPAVATNTTTVWGFSPLVTIEF